MKQQELLLQITKYFSRFREQIHILNSNSEFSINIHAENVLINILNCIYNCDLENVNYSENKNYDSIDLRAKDSSIAIQVTSTSNITKIKNTLSKYISNGHYEAYEKIKVLILTNKQRSYSQNSIDKITDGKIHFDVNQDILDFSNLYLELNKQNNLSKIFVVKNLLEEQFSDKISHSIESEITTFRDLCKSIIPYLNENQKLFKDFGPNSGANSVGEVRWDMTLWYKVRNEKILPNNNLIAAMLVSYESLIPEEYISVVDKFKNHAYAFEKHCENPYFDYSQYLFPNDFPDIIINGTD